MLGGSDKQVTLWTREGFKLKELGKGYNGWVWTAEPRPKSNMIAVGSNDGELSMLQLKFATVHGLFRNRYAYRDHMTDVIVQHLITDKKVRIRCRDYIKKIAVYQDRLAVQLPSRVIIYELQGGGRGGRKSVRSGEGSPPIQVDSRPDLTGRRPFGLDRHKHALHVAHEDQQEIRVPAACSDFAAHNSLPTAPPSVVQLQGVRERGGFLTTSSSTSRFLEVRLAARRACRPQEWLCAPDLCGQPISHGTRSCKLRCSLSRHVGVAQKAGYCGRPVQLPRV